MCIGQRFALLEIKVGRLIKNLERMSSGNPDDVSGRRGEDPERLFGRQERRDPGEHRAQTGQFHHSIGSPTFGQI